MLVLCINPCIKGPDIVKLPVHVVIKPPIQNRPQTLGNIGELSGVIVLPTTIGHNGQALELGLGVWIFLLQFW